jgi:hypothetical protein
MRTWDIWITGILRKTGNGFLRSSCRDIVPQFPHPYREAPGRNVLVSEAGLNIWEILVPLGWGEDHQNRGYIRGRDPTSAWFLVPAPRPSYFRDGLGSPGTGFLLLG